MAAFSVRLIRTVLQKYSTLFDVRPGVPWPRHFSPAKELSMKRIFLFLATNMAIVLVLSVTMRCWGSSPT
jgi:hypothetical protein